MVVTSTHILGRESGSICLTGTDSRARFKVVGLDPSMFHPLRDMLRGPVDVNWIEPIGSTWVFTLRRPATSPPIANGIRRRAEKQSVLDSADSKGTLSSAERTVSEPARLTGGVGSDASDALRRLRLGHAGTFS